ncbi:MAG: malate dehydrogenase [Candidatus Bathyarchaeia archaeon]
MRGLVKAAVIGVGALGSCIAYEIANRGLVDELLLVDIVKELAEGQATDIEQALAFRNNTKVYTGDYGDTFDSDLIVIAAGKARTPGMKSRLQLFEVNAQIVKDVATRLKGARSDCVFVTLTNPLDLINYLVWRTLKRDRRYIIGSSGQLDSARFRSVLAKRFSTPVLDVEAYVIGEHGDRQVPLFEMVRVRGELRTFSEEDKRAILAELRDYALRVVQKKGATVYAPANNTAEMVEAILKDRNRLVCCSLVLQGEYGLSEVSIGVPVILGREGAKRVVEWELTPAEREALHSGAQELKRAWGQLKET